jgi:carboxyl-terminal processing protease
MKKAWPVLLLAPLLVVLFAGPRARQDEVWDQSLEKVNALASAVEKHYFQPVEPVKMAQESIKGMLQTLDPHSYFLGPDDFARMFEEQRGKYYGIGTQIQKQEDRLIVIAPIEGGPAWRLGVQAGDIISKINGESTKSITSLDAVDKLRGPKGTKVAITIVRERFEQPIELTIIREEIPLYSVPYAFMLDEDQGVGYIFIRNFAETTADEFAGKLAFLSGKGMKSLVLDLRSNPGGAIDPAIKISDEFLPRGTLIVSVKGRNRIYDHDFLAVRGGQYEKLPLIVLVDQGSASSSEIVAGAIMDHDRGLIIGEDSFGKGLVQTIFPLASNMAFALTIGKYYTPSGRLIQRDYSHFDDYILDAKTSPENTREVKFTDKGRKVLGQGGITPDYEVKFNVLVYTVQLRAQGAFFSYARKFVGHQTALSKKYLFPQEAKDAAGTASGQVQVARPFVADASIVEDFRQYVLANKLRFDEKAFKLADAEIRREIEREISSAVWGIEEGWRAFERNDPVILKALQSMPEAAKFLM